ncbi:hypothetical protein C8F01DRAFT_3358 [Mycena amicta]|nr:hypothetical protein C8F01DRAFT_3358 [Mycena amicta]
MARGPLPVAPYNVAPADAFSMPAPAPAAGYGHPGHGAQAQYSQYSGYNYGPSALSSTHIVFCETDHGEDDPAAVSLFPPPFVSQDVFAAMSISILKSQSLGKIKWLVLSLRTARNESVVTNSQDSSPARAHQLQPHLRRPTRRYPYPNRATRRSRRLYSPDACGDLQSHRTRSRDCHLPLSNPGYRPRHPTIQLDAPHQEPTHTREYHLPHTGSRDATAVR